MSALRRIIQRARLRGARKAQGKQLPCQIAKRSQFILEPMEPRLLLSVAAAPAAVIADLHTAAGPASITLPFDVAEPVNTAKDTDKFTPFFAPQLREAELTKRAGADGDGNELAAQQLLDPEIAITSLASGPASNTSVQTLADALLPPLVVTGFIPGQTGFTVKFNREIDASVISLYDVESGSIGAADVTLTGAISGQVKGSLIFYSDQLWFFARGGVLAPDTYTATLRTANNAIKDTSGNLLDGNNDGIAGDSYSSIFTINPSSGVVVSIPDFARAPGQGVSVPNSDGGIPVTLSNAAGVTSVDLTLSYNPALFDVIGVKPGNSVPAGSLVHATYFSDFGQVEINVTSPVALPAGTLEILRLTARVPESVVYGTASILFISSATFNTGSAARLDPALIVAANFGDTTGNGAYSSLDAQRALRVAAGLDSGFAAFPGIDPVIIGDISGNGQISSLDATRILQFAAGIPTPQIPHLVEWINPGSGFWDDPSNWSAGVVPGAGDDVLIDRHEDITITFRTGTSIINRLISRASLAITGGILQVNDTMQVDGDFTIGNGATLRNATLLPSAGGHEAHVISSANFDHVIIMGKVTIDDLGSVQVQNGLTVDGRLTLASAGNPTSITFAGTQTLTGSGEIFLAGAAEHSDNRLDSGSDGTLTIDLGIDFRGTASGSIGTSFSNETIILYGAILADTPNQSIRLGGNATQIFGKLHVSNFATIFLDGTVSFPDVPFRASDGGNIVLTGTLDNTGKTLLLDSFTGSFISKNGTIKGGLIKTTEGAQLLRLSNVTLDGVTLGSNYLVFDGTETLVRNGLTLDQVQVFFFDDSTTPYPAIMRFLDDSTLGGTGQISFSGGDANELSGTTGFTLTIGPNIIILGRDGGGTVGIAGNLINQGTIAVLDDTADITVSGESVTNEGSLLTFDGGDILLSGAFTNTGRIEITASDSEVQLLSGTMTQNDGFTRISGGSLRAPTVDLQGGGLLGFGTVAGNFINNAAVFVGESIGESTTGILKVDGSYTQTQTGSLSARIGGTTTGTQFDQLQITGAANLAGLLNVSLIDNFLPEIGQNFAVITYGSDGTTTFDGIGGLEIGSGRAFNPVYNTTNLTLQTVAALPPPELTNELAAARLTNHLNDPIAAALKLDVAQSVTLTKKTGKDWLFYSEPA